MRDSSECGCPLALEHDPFEILKLGTYAGTCLAIGGLCDDSAAAVLLDANRQVIYARDRWGRFVARQALAISDQDQLICFEVYPRSTPAPVERLFRDYDVAFAHALGQSLYDTASEDGYQVSSVLSVYWWDDGN